ncbi:preprotein translocase subunit SecA [Prosthecobacter sp.]|uniref:preprotein translocase subunit SecA n=1 Tax=Prosthecobacter sp. TaxID=1965333 RepID=UPI002AB815F9|nr:preprotein translocase subunit SecA [Prosthecobacter sp.]MDZ4405967.1 preprotein translocase subunit SecA [Prosthecobacter sp.]
MFNWIIKKIIGTKNQRTVRKLMPAVAEINRHEEQLQQEPEDALRERTQKWQAQFRAFHTPPFLGGVSLRIADEAAVDACLEQVEQYFAALKQHFQALEDDYIAQGRWRTAALDEKKTRIDRAREAWNAIQPDFAAIEQKMLNDILPEAYAVVKNAARRMCGSEIVVCDQPLGWNMIHFDVQLVGGVALHRGMIAEMATGEGKTLVGTLPVYLNALTGRGVHVITVNDYLARRDSEWMGSLYKFLGLTVGCIQNDQPSHIRREQYQADITYGTNSEFGFDYLRDNGMASSKEQQVQRGHYFAIVDEVDSVLIDEARTPLIISGPVMAAESNHQYERYKPLVDQLVRRQNTLCNRLITEAKEAAAAGVLEQAGLKLFQVHMGQPKNRALARCMEEPELRRAMEKAELSLYADTQKVEFFKLKEELYYFIEEKSHDADLTEMGRNFLSPDEPDAFVLPDIATVYSEIDGDTSLSEEARQRKKTEMQDRLSHQGQRIHQISQLLRAFCLYEKDVEYVVEENKVIIVDAQTGRKMAGRRWSDGLHQAVEAKEGVQIDAETQTLATITIQNYFRLYMKLGGMTGTAETDAAEFHDIYNLDVLTIPTNRPVKRKDHNDSIYKTRREKFAAVIDLIRELNAKGQPILVGTASVEASEMVSRMLKLQKITHNVLNAKYHRQEAEIVARAGHRSAVTISTNMAGRGTDIKLGEGVSDLGGLFVLATERHESRRVDRQLRGRSARQGDPGESKFFLSFEDDLMRNFGAAERMTKMMERFGMKEGEELQHPWLNRSVETAQKRVEQRNYVWRKRVLEYDDVMNQQREVVYEWRNDVLNSNDTRILINEAVEKGITERLSVFVPKDAKDDSEADYDNLLQWVNTTFPIGLREFDDAFKALDFDAKSAWLKEKILNAYGVKVGNANPTALQEIEKMILLNAIDRLWQEHLYALDALKEGVSLRTYGQKDPLIEFKQEAFTIFAELMNNINGEVLGNLFRSTQQLAAFEQFLAQMAAQQSGESAAPQRRQEDEEGGEEAPPNPGRDGPRLIIPSAGSNKPKPDHSKVGRNDPCPCGSGKKFKQCCGRIA